EPPACGRDREPADALEALALGRRGGFALLAVPGDREVEPLVEADLGREAEEGLGLRRVRDAVDDVLVLARQRLVADVPSAERARGEAELLLDELREALDGDRLDAAEVDHLAARLRPL